MARSGVAALTLAVVMALFEFRSCLRCYQCLSNEHKTCSDSPPPTRFLKDCSWQAVVDFNMKYPNMPRQVGDTRRGKSYCVKALINNTVIARSCIAVNCDVAMKYARQMAEGGNVAVKECHSCDKSRCNAASSHAASLPLTGLALIISYLHTQ